MKKLYLYLIVLFSLGSGASLFAQQVLYFGLSGGVALPVIDFSKDAVFYYESVNKFPLGDLKVNFNPQADFAPSINTSLYLGFEANKYFGVRLGADFYFNVTEQALIDFYSTDKSVEVNSTISYQYNLVNIPLLSQLYFINGNVFRLGIEAGPFFGFPLGQINRTVEGAVKGDTSGTTPVAITNPQAASLDGRLMVGIQIGLLSEFKIGRGAFTFNIDFMRNLYNSISPVMPDVMFDPEATIAIPGEVTEEKITIFQGIKISIGYKFNFQLSGPPAQASNEELTVSDNNINYYIVVGTQAEGPLKISDMRNLHRRGILKADTLLWKTGADNWTQAADLPEFAPLFR